jgi:hypothetical protein
MKRRVNAFRLAKLAMRPELSHWERKFVASVAHRPRLTPTQQKIVERLCREYLAEDVMNEADAAIFEGHECVVLSAMMNGAGELPVCAEDFSSPPNRTIFERIIPLENRGFIAVTLSECNSAGSKIKICCSTFPLARMTRKRARVSVVVDPVHFGSSSVTSRH